MDSMFSFLLKANLAENMQKTGNVLNNLKKQQQKTMRWMYQKQIKLDVDDLLLTILSIPIIPVLTGVESLVFCNKPKRTPPKPGR